MQQMHRDRAVRDGLVSAAMQTEESIDAVFFVLRAQQFASFRRGGGDISARQLARRCVITRVRPSGRK
jgi:hypothetical protein